MAKIKWTGFKTKGGKNVSFGRPGCGKGGGGTSGGK